MLDLLISRKYLPASRFLLPDSLCHRTFIPCMYRGHTWSFLAASRRALLLKIPIFLGFRKAFPRQLLLWEILTQEA